MIKKESGFKDGDKVISSEITYTLTKEDLEQIAREAAMFGYNFARDNVVEINPVIEIHKFLGAIKDYWQKKTESKEAGNE
jgi:KaiC/GvpD/RAD55 family RecA-like ATPase